MLRNVTKLTSDVFPWEKFYCQLIEKKNNNSLAYWYLKLHVSGFIPRAFEILFHHQQIPLLVLVMFHIFIGIGE